MEIQFTYFKKMDGQIYTDIVDQLVLNINPSLTVSGNGEVQTTDNIFMILDNELVQGAKLEIEYEITAYALNGVAGLTITDYVADSGLAYDPNSKLLTEDKTNEEIGWKYGDNGTVIATFDSNGGNMPSNTGKKIVLSKLLSTNDDTVYENTALCGTSSYGVGQTTASTLNRLVQSESVVIIPPTGENHIIEIAIALLGFILIVFLIIKKIKAKKNN